jgi:hypothetical protein
MKRRLGDILAGLVVILIMAIGLASLLLVDTVNHRDRWGPICWATVIVFTLAGSISAYLVLGWGVLGSGTLAVLGFVAGLMVIGFFALFSTLSVEPAEEH